MIKILIILSAVFSLALCFCGDHNLHGNLAESAVQISNWLREYHHGNGIRLEPHVTSAMIVSLRLIGHLPRTIMNDFKTNDSYSVTDYLASYLDSQYKQHKSLSEIKPGRIAYMFQAVSALCLDPQDFNGHNLTGALLHSFNARRLQSSCKNHFEYSLVSLAVCQSLGQKTQPNLVRIILHEINKTVKMRRGQMTRRLLRENIPDSLAMIIMALSCLRKNIPESDVELSQNIASTISKVVKVVEQLEALRRRKYTKWNAQSNGLIVQAFMSLPKELRPKHWHCKRRLSDILTKHDPRNAFGNILANIQILPALLGRSLVDLNTSCKEHEHVDSQDKSNKNINACIKLAFPDLNRTPPKPVHLVVPEKTTAFDIIKLAAEQNDAYKFKAQKTSYGRMITSISGIEQNSITGHYWLLYAGNGSLASDGVDIFTPKNNTCFIFKYENCSSVEDNKKIENNNKDEDNSNAFN